MGRAVVTPVLLDTHALVWLLAGDSSVGNQARELIDAGAREDALLVSAISFWEVAMLAQRRRLTLNLPAAQWRRQVLELGIAEIAVSGDVGILATELEEFQPDPADRMIAATALLQGATLITADASILSWRGNLVRQDARR
ncbi:MAG: type II toxin-antitoxin system VapC family toxin [Dehalococcoidia bacterium]|nr:type II toxin-antitoxin system VapC family toxin [Dehalococcoidia bacterium]